jgi:hypothetical protein
LNIIKIDLYFKENRLYYILMSNKNTNSENEIDFEKLNLKDNGVEIRENILSSKECKKYIKGNWDWLESLGSGIDRNSPETWKNDKWIIAPHDIIKNYRAAHQQFVWDIREHPNVVEQFKKIWDTDDLLVSFDAINVTRPNVRQDSKYWLHIDQGKKKMGFQCIQSAVNLTSSDTDDACFLCIVNSHHYHKKFWKKFGDEIDNNSDWIPLEEKYINWYLKRKKKGKCFLQRIPCKAGGMVFWDSRTVHSGARPLKNRKHPDRFRFVAYVCMTPREKATETMLKKKQKAFNEKRTTNHWPHIPKIDGLKPQLYGKEHHIDFDALEIPNPKVANLRACGFD